MITYAVLDRITPGEFLEYVDFLRNFERGYHASKKTAWSIVSLISARKGFSVEIPEEFAEFAVVNAGNPVLSRELAETVRSVSENTEKAVA